MLSLAEKKDLHFLIAEAEKKIQGEIHVAFYLRVRYPDVLQDAQEYFYKMNLHKKKNKNIALIYIAQLDQKFSILGNEEMDSFISEKNWQNLCLELGKFFKHNEIYSGLQHCIERIVQLNGQVQN